MDGFDLESDSGFANLETGKVGTGLPENQPGVRSLLRRDATTVGKPPSRGQGGLPTPRRALQGAEIFLDSKILGGATSTQESRNLLRRLPQPISSGSSFLSR